MPSTDAIYAPYRDTLLEIARRSIQYGLAQGRPPRVAADHYPLALRETAACFVTLIQNGKLRGCIGTLEAHRPLVEDVTENAYAAAFSDPRFEPVADAAEAAGLEIHIAVLTPPEVLHCDSRTALLAMLRPGIDGLIVEDGPYRGTFLPSVWTSLASPGTFLDHLMEKAGLPREHWSDSLRIYRYRTEVIE